MKRSRNHHIATGDPIPTLDSAASGETALLVATACSSLPKGRKRWTLNLLAGAMIDLTEHEGLSREIVRWRMAEGNLKPRPVASS